jgi:hypothetical protein
VNKHAAIEKLLNVSFSVWWVWWVLSSSQNFIVSLFITIPFRGLPVYINLHVSPFVVLHDGNPWLAILSLIS